MSSITIGFLGNIHGQKDLYTSQLKPHLKNLDHVLQMGAFIGLMKGLVDETKNNESLLREALEKTKNHEWTMLVGPNEMLALNFPDHFTNLKSGHMLRQLWFTENDDARMKVAISNNERLITHGGLTHGEWVSIGKPQTSEEAAYRLNMKYSKRLFVGESIALGYKPNHSANPIFADPYLEFFPSWLTSNDEMPFTQIHSSQSLNTEKGREILNDELNPLHHAEKVLFRKYGSIINIGEKQIISVDTQMPILRDTKLYKNTSVYVEKQKI